MNSNEPRDPCEDERDDPDFRFFDQLMRKAPGS